MLLDEVKTIVYLHGDKIVAGTVTLGETVKLGDSIENEWTAENLKEIFWGIKRVFGNGNLRIVADDSLCDKSLTLNKDLFQKLAAAAKETETKIEAIEAVSQAKIRHENPMIGLAIKKIETAIDTNHVAKTPSVKKVLTKKVVLIATGTGILVLLAIFGIFAWSKNPAEDKPVIEPVVSEPTPIEISNPTPAVTPERSDLKIKILNGSGKVGLAGKVKNQLEDMGYEEIETGNADRFDYEKTEIQIKEEKEDFLELLINDLGEEYPLSSQSSVPLESASAFDALIILGKE